MTASDQFVNTDKVRDLNLKGLKQVLYNTCYIMSHSTNLDNLNSPSFDGIGGLSESDAGPRRVNRPGRGPPGIGSRPDRHEAVTVPDRP